MMLLDTARYAHLAELVICCSTKGAIRYPNPAAQRWGNESPEGSPFANLFTDASESTNFSFLDSVHLGIELPGFLVHSDGQRVVAYVLARIPGCREQAKAGPWLKVMGMAEP